MALHKLKITEFENKLKELAKEYDVDLSVFEVRKGLISDIRIQCSFNGHPGRGLSAAAKAISADVKK